MIVAVKVKSEEGYVFGGYSDAAGRHLEDMSLKVEHLYSVSTPMSSKPG